MSSPPNPQPSYPIPNDNSKTKNRRPSPSSSPPALTPSETASNLPQPRQLNKQNKLNPLLRNVEPPLYNTRLSSLIYVLVGLTSLLMVYYSYRGVKVQSSWWNLFMGGEGAVDETVAATTTSSRSAASTTKANIDTVESHILALAAALGVPTHELASAIAGAVRAHVPPASLSSIRERETGEVVRILLEEPEAEAAGAAGATATATATGGHGRAWEAASTAAGVVGGVVEGVENLVGMMD